jgi:hypothetical protein
MPLLRGKESRTYKSKKPTSERAKGQFTIDRESVIRVDRTNTNGKYEIELRPQGPKRPSFSKRHNPPPRLLHVSCEAKSHSSEFLQMSSDCFRLALWTFPEIRSMIALAVGSPIGHSTELQPSSAD